MRQKVRSASRTKALLHNIDLGCEHEIHVHSVNAEDEVSEEVTMVYTPLMEFVNKKQSVKTLKNHKDAFNGAHL